VQSGQQPLAGEGGQGGGTRAVFRPSSPGFVPEFQPDSPFANADGLVAAPDVNPVTTSVEQIQGLRAYQANLSALRVADQTQRDAINLLA